MIRVEIDNSVCSVTGLNDEQFQDLRNLMSYTEATRNYRGFQNVRKYLMSKRGEFPTGLLYLLEEFIAEGKLGAPFKALDKRVRPQTPAPGSRKIKLNGLRPYPEQREAAMAAFSNERGIVVAPTGCGKSLIAALICNIFGVPTLIVVPSLELKTQLTSSLRALFGQDYVGPLTKSGDRQFFITVENVDALSTKKKIPGIDLVIIDEFHHSGAKTYRELNKHAWSGVYYKIGLTATPFRSKDTERLLLESVLSKVVYRIDYQTAVEKGYIAPLEAYYYDLPKKVLECNGRSYAGVYNELVVKREDRNKLIALLTANLVESGCSTLVLTKQIEHGHSIQDLLAELGVSVPFAKGENTSNRELILEFNLREKLGLIGTVGVIGEGVDSKPAEYVLLAGGGRSKNQLMQAFGRVFRKYPGKESGKVILFRDCSHKWFVDHFRQQCKILRDEYGITPIKLELPDDFKEAA